MVVVLVMVMVVVMVMVMVVVVAVGEWWRGGGTGGSGIHKRWIDGGVGGGGPSAHTVARRRLLRRRPWRTTRRHAVVEVVSSPHATKLGDPSGTRFIHGAGGAADRAVRRTWSGAAGNASSRAGGG